MMYKKDRLPDWKSFQYSVRSFSVQNIRAANDHADIPSICSIFQKFSNIGKRLSLPMLLQHQQKLI